jgi:glutaredoxin
MRSPLRKSFFIGFVVALSLVLIHSPAQAVAKTVSGTNRIVVYTTRSCPYCEMLRRSLQASQVSYTEYDVERSLQGQLGMWALGGRGVPGAVIGPQVVYGYRVAEIAEALKALGYTFLPARYERPRRSAQ